MVSEVSDATALGQVMGLIFLSSASFFVLVLTHRMGVMVFICLLKSLRSDMFSS